MAKLVSAWQLFALTYTVIQVFAQDRQKKFEWLDKLDGKICEESETLFTASSPSLLACCSICAGNASCASLFYRDANSTCIGCARTYMTDSGLNNVDGTKYLFDPKLVTTTTSSTSTSSTTTTSSTITTTTSLTTTSKATTTTSPESEWKYYDGHLYKLEQELANYTDAVNYSDSVDSSEESTPNWRKGNF